MLSSTPARTNPVVLLVVLSALVLGGAFRLYDAGHKSMSHPEMFVPNVRLPAGLAVPDQRTSLFNHVILGTIGLDTHPPGYYVTLWFVTKIFGTSTWAMRMPSILFGVGSIALLYWLGTLIGQR